MAKIKYLYTVYEDFRDNIIIAKAEIIKETSKRIYISKKDAGLAFDCRAWFSKDNPYIAYSPEEAKKVYVELKQRELGDAQLAVIDAEDDLKRAKKLKTSRSVLARL